MRTSKKTIIAALGVTAGIFSGLAGLLFHFGYQSSGFIFSALAIAALLFLLFIHRKEDQSQRLPIKIVFLDNKEVFRTKYEEDKPVEFQKLIMALVSNPFFPPGLKKTIQSNGLASFDLINLEKKKLIPKQPKMMSGVKSTMIIFLHKDFMSDLPVETKSDIVLKTYFTD
jgi:hypothetical protein